jgi:small-conductance mechanosensitive channel
VQPSTWSAAVRDAAAAMAERVAARLPDVLGAALLLLAGWLLARTTRAVLVRMLGGALERLERRRLLGGEDPLGLRRSLPRLVGGFAFLVVMAVFTVAAADTLGLAVMGELLATLARQLPRVLVGLLVVFAGIAFGGLVHDAVLGASARAGLPYGRTLARTAQAATVVLAVVMGASQAGIDSTFLMIALPVAMGALLGGAALAFGLGSRSAISSIIASYHLQRLYEVGQRVRIAGFEGRIVKITPVAVVLDAAEGRVAVPAKLFSEEVSVLLTGSEP